MRKLGGKVKSFYPDSVAGAARRLGVSAEPAVSLAEEAPSYISTRARVAVYDAPASAPLVEDVGPAPASDCIEQLANKVFSLARERGGSIPYTVIREVSENLLHAGFAEPVVSIMDGGRTIRFSDQGPGIPDKDHALLPGFTTATWDMKRIIRGVGSGLPIVNDFLSVSGGSLSIEDNLGGGCVITLHSTCGLDPDRSTDEGLYRSISPTELPARTNPSPKLAADPVPPPQPAVLTHLGSTDDPASLPPTLFGLPVRPAPALTTRQKQVLALVLETGQAGPSVVSRELGVGLSTAFRDLAFLEERGLISSESGKRTVTNEGAAVLGSLMSSSTDS